MGSYMLLQNSVQVWCVVSMVAVPFVAKMLLCCQVLMCYCHQGDQSSWKVMEFSKTVFHSRKVMENSQGHGKSWKMMMMSGNFFVKMH